MVRKYQTSIGNSISLGEVVGKGGEGTVYKINEKDGYVAKIYKSRPSAAKQEKIEILSKLSPNSTIRDYACLPVSALYEGSRLVGFYMKSVMNANPIHELYSPITRKLKYPDVSASFLLNVAKNISLAVYHIHNEGIVIGDINENIFMVHDNSVVSCIDTDSFQVINNNRAYLCKVGVEDYQPPELVKADYKKTIRKKEHDHFGLAVLIFQLLTAGRHPFSGSSKDRGELIAKSHFPYKRQRNDVRDFVGSVTYNSLPSVFKVMFESAFETSNRPTAGDWYRELASEFKKLRQCSKNKNHQYTSASCPYCGILNETSFELFGKADLSATSKSSEKSINKILAQLDSGLTSLNSKINFLTSQSFPALLDPLTIQAPAMAVPFNRLNETKLISVTLVIAILALLSLPPSNAIVITAISGFCLGVYELFNGQWSQEKSRRESKMKVARENWTRNVESKFNQIFEYYKSSQQVNSLIQQKEEGVKIQTSINQKVRTARDNYKKNYIYNELKSFEVSGCPFGRLTLIRDAGITNMAQVTSQKLFSIYGVGEVTVSQVMHEKNKIVNALKVPELSKKDLDKEILLLINKVTEIVNRGIQITSKVEERRKTALQFYTKDYSPTKIQNTATKYAQAVADYQVM